MGKLKYPTLGHQTSMYQFWVVGKCYVFVRRSANVNVTQLDQNDLPCRFSLTCIRLLDTFAAKINQKHSYRILKLLRDMCFLHDIAVQVSIYREGKAQHDPPDECQFCHFTEYEFKGRSS